MTSVGVGGGDQACAGGRLSHVTVELDSRRYCIVTADKGEPEDFKRRK